MIYEPLTQKEKEILNAICEKGLKIKILPNTFV